jgi:hypothetical protein
MSNKHNRSAVALGMSTATRLEQATGLNGHDAVATYGALLQRSAVAAARIDDRDTADAILDEAERAGRRLGGDGNDRWTGFGPTNVAQHRVNVALTFGDAGTAIAIAKKIPLDKIRLAERRAALFVDVARAYTMWGRHELALNALHSAMATAPQEITSRASAARLVTDLAALARGHTRARVIEFAGRAGIRL